MHRAEPVYLPLSLLNNAYWNPEMETVKSSLDDGQTNSEIFFVTAFLVPCCEQSQLPVMHHY